MENQTQSLNLVKSVSNHPLQTLINRWNAILPLDVNADHADQSIPMTPSAPAGYTSSSDIHGIHSETADLQTVIVNQSPSNIFKGGVV